MVPEEIDQLGEKLDKLGWNEIRRPRRHPLYKAQDDIEYDARDAAPQHRFCLDRHDHDAGGRNPRNQGRPESRVERAGAHQVVGDQRGKGSGRALAQGLGNTGRQGPPAQGERRRDAKERDSSPRRQPQNQELVNGHRGHLFRQIQHRTPTQWQCRPRRLPARQYS